MSIATEEGLEQNQQAFDSSFDELMRVHPGRHAVFHDGALAGVFDLYDDAYSFALNTYGVDGTFLISQIVRRDRQPPSISWYAGVLFG